MLLSLINYCLHVFQTLILASDLLICIFTSHVIDGNQGRNAFSFSHIFLACKRSWLKDVRQLMFPSFWWRVSKWLLWYLSMICWSVFSYHMPLQDIKVEYYHHWRGFYFELFLWYWISRISRKEITHFLSWLN